MAVNLWKIKIGLKDLNWKSLEERRKYLKSISATKFWMATPLQNLKDVSYVSNERDNACNLRNRETELALHIPKKEFGRRCFGY